jgi:hypothetical protein
MTGRFIKKVVRGRRGARSTHIREGPLPGPLR